MSKITLEQLLDTIYFGDPNKQQVMVYFREPYYEYESSYEFDKRIFEHPEFTIGCSTTITAKDFIKDVWLNKVCDIIDICADGNIRVVLDMGEDE